MKKTCLNTDEMVETFTSYDTRRDWSEKPRASLYTCYWGSGGSATEEKLRLWQLTRDHRVPVLVIVGVTQKHLVFPRTLKCRQFYGSESNRTLWFLMRKLARLQRNPRSSN